MKLIDDPRFAVEALADLVLDPRTRPMVRHYLIAAVAERSTCEPADEPLYVELVLRIARALEEGEA